MIKPIKKGFYLYKKEFIEFSNINSAIFKEHFSQVGEMTKSGY